MREIKFRAIENIHKQWIYSNGYYFDSINYWVLIPDKSLALAWAIHHIINHDTLSQYIGLHDKNGKEIYEGDIIAYYDADDGKNRVGVLEFEDLSDVPDWIIWSDKEVIGNIYENPELLEN